MNTSRSYHPPQRSASLVSDLDQLCDVTQAQWEMIQLRQPDLCTGCNAAFHLSAAGQTWKYGDPTKVPTDWRCNTVGDSMLRSTGSSCRSILGNGISASPARRPATSAGVLRGAIRGCLASTSYAIAANEYVSAALLRPADVCVPAMSSGAT